MKAFLAAVAAAVLIAVVAGVISNNLQVSSATAYQSAHGNVRL